MLLIRGRLIVFIFRVDSGYFLLFEEVESKDNFSELTREQLNLLRTCIRVNKILFGANSFLYQVEDRFFFLDETEPV